MDYPVVIKYWSIGHVRLNIRLDMKHASSRPRTACPPWWARSSTTAPTASPVSTVISTSAGPASGRTSSAWWRPAATWAAGNVKTKNQWKNFKETLQNWVHFMDKLIKTTIYIQQNMVNFLLNGSTGRLPTSAPLPAWPISISTTIPHSTRRRPSRGLVKAARDRRSLVAL